MEGSRLMVNWILILLIHLGLLMLLAVSFNITAGYLGYVNMATAAVYGVGANITAVLTTSFGWNFFPTVFFAAVAGLGLGIILGLPSIRVRGIYYLIVSIGLQLLFHDILKNWSLGGDKEGISNIPFPSLLGFTFSSPLQYSLLIGMTLAFTLLITYRISTSPFGRLMRGVRDNELLAITLGKDVSRLKLQAFAYSGSIAAIAGSLHAGHTRFVSYEAFGLDLSITLLLVVTIGGAGHFWGPLVGAVLVMGLPELLRFLPINDAHVPIYERILYASILLLLLRFRPTGLVGAYQALVTNFRRFNSPVINRVNS
jgi:branched-chain amino acid transport system permease protein